MTRDFCRAMFEAAVARAQPSICLPSHLPPPPLGRLVVLACGKAGATMAEAVEAHYLDGHGLAPDRIGGLCVTRHGYGRRLRSIRCVEAGHPVPDEAGLAATSETLDLAGTAGPDDLVLVLVSGGGSANWTAPAPGLTLQDKQSLTRALLACGAPIGDINTVRKHLSRIKGGRLAAAIAPARSLTLVISDVPGDDPSFIASGPTVPDRTTGDDAIRILEHWNVPVPDAIRAILAGPDGQTPDPTDPLFAQAELRVVARPADSLEAAADIARARGYRVTMLGDSLEGEARDVAARHASLAENEIGSGAPVVLLSGGELTVTIAGSGRGGPNQEYALAMLARLPSECVSGLAADTDGTDGGGGSADDPAGAFFDAGLLRRAAADGIDPEAYLADNDSTGFFERVDGLLFTGPTGTNVNDFRALVVDTTAEAAQNAGGREMFETDAKVKQ